jgi:CubicO group peptidase (beta-lactamase class C family)
MIGDIDDLFSSWDRADSPGCAVAIYRDGEIEIAPTFGMANLEHAIPVTPSTVFHIASISKMFTAYAIALLARDGTLALDDDLRKYIPELITSVTIRQIIHHTSGMRDQWDLLRLAGWRNADLKTNADILRLACRQRELNFAPGTRFQYINTGYTLLGIAVERITGKSLRAFTAERIFTPLAMHHTQFHDDANRIVPRRAQAYARGASGTPRIDMPAYETVGPTSLLSTIEDFAHWEKHLLTADRDLIAFLTNSGTLTDGRPTNYGFGCILGEYRGLPVIEHAGGDGGYRAHYLRVPGERFAVAIFGNVSDLKPGILAREIADRVLAGRFPIAESDHALPAWAGRGAGIASADPADLLAKSGNYRDVLSGMTCRIEPRGGRLFMVADAGGEYELAPAGPDRFRFLIVDAECIWSDGKLHILYGGNEQALCERVDEAAPELAPLDDYRGAYDSDELDVRYIIKRDGDQLVLTRAKFEPGPLHPVARDEFTSIADGVQLRFVRGDNGAVNGMLLNAERVWNVRFTRASDREEEMFSSPARS